MALNKETKDYNCIYCNSTFANINNLKVHQKTAKFCLQIQNKPIEEKYNCEYCNKGFSLKSHYTSHITNCKDKKNIEEQTQNSLLLKRIKELEDELKLKDKEYENELKLKYKELTKKDKELTKKDNIITELKTKCSSKDEIIKKLEKTNKELLTRTTSITNNDNRHQTQYNIHFNQLFEKLPVLNEENVNNRINELSNEDKINQYNLNHFYKEALESITYQLKDFSFCTDPSRKMVVIKDESENSVKMNAEEFLSKSFQLGSESIKKHITYADQVVNDRIDNNDPKITSEMLDNFNDDRDVFRERLKNSKENFFLSSNQTDNKTESYIVLNCVKQLEKCSK
jgi:hypothetical protein